MYALKFTQRFSLIPIGKYRETIKTKDQPFVQSSRSTPRMTLTSDGGNTRGARLARFENLNRSRSSYLESYPAICKAEHLLNCRISSICPDLCPASFLHMRSVRNYRSFCLGHLSLWSGLANESNALVRSKIWVKLSNS